MKACIIMNIRLQPGRERDFVRAYPAIHDQVVRGKGHVGDRVCQIQDDPLNWAIVSEWDSVEHFQEWERSAGYPELTQLLRDCGAVTQTRQYVVWAETGQPVAA
jgi:heme-degrading monooxygenase HmoA